MYYKVHRCIVLSMAISRSNAVASWALVLFSLSALLPVLNAYRPGHPPQPDEGTGAHIFQLSIVALVPAFAAFLATADWQHPRPHLRRLLFPIVAVVVAFVALYYLENYYQPAHYR